ncbi:hypothetical protein CNR22_07645 [Sphingobacteriaceae bacterium]|nr:hypothetical protein CNR22_07645 [Sphingobacteriaceae bacterium]
MKKHLLLGSVLFAAMSAFSQNVQKPRPSGLVNSKIIAQNKFGDEAFPTAVTNEVKPHASAAKPSSPTTWQNFTASMNIYGVVIPYCKPLQWNDELNAVTFVHRKSPTYSNNGTTTDTQSGSIVTMISLDCGTTWDSTLVYADAVNRGRYPQGAIYNPQGNTNINNAHIVTTGPVTLGSGFVGNFYASKPLGTANYNSTISAVPGAVQYYVSTNTYSNLGMHDFSAYGFSATDDGKMRSLAGITNHVTDVDTAIMLVTGTYNNGVFNWTGHVFDPPVTVAPTDNSENFVSRPMMAWNESGKVGYVLILGSRLGATGSNVGYQPIVYKTTDFGVTWTLENGIDFNNVAYKDVKRSLSTVQTDSTLEVPFFNWIESIDCAVDANNKLHIFSTVIGQYSNDPDSIGYTTVFGAEGYRWPHTAGFRPYLWDFTYDGDNATPSWSHMLIDSMSSEGPAGVSTGKGYLDNPWDMDPLQTNQKVRIDARLQMSRTPDGKQLIYTWAESDTAFTDAQKKWNVLPNIKARLFDVVTGSLSPTEIDATLDGGAEVASHAMYDFVSPKFKLAQTVDKFTVNLPMTVSNSSPYAQTTTNQHYYSCSPLEFEKPIGIIDGIKENKNTIAANSSIFPNPAKNSVSVKLNLVNSSKVQVEILNTIGQVVKAVQSQGQTGVNVVSAELSGLSSGVYFVNIKVDNASSTKKLIIE